ncbi:hypothetical protein AHAS_Ahas15G0291000 [Arachis hypogaea]
MSVEKKTIVEKMGFGALAHIPELNISHMFLRELICCFDSYHGCLDTLYSKTYIIHAKIRDALGINFGGIIVFTFYICATLVSLTKSVIDMSVGGEKNWLKFKTTFVIFI